jgi:hypothetical protein
MPEYPSRWELLKKRVQYLNESGGFHGEAAELGFALCEELDIIQIQINLLEEKIRRLELSMRRMEER